MTPEEILEYAQTGSGCKLDTNWLQEIFCTDAESVIIKHSALENKGNINRAMNVTFPKHSLVEHMHLKDYIEFHGFHTAWGF